MHKVQLRQNPNILKEKYTQVPPLNRKLFGIDTHWQRENLVLSNSVPLGIFQPQSKAGPTPRVAGCDRTDCTGWWGGGCVFCLYFLSYWFWFVWSFSVLAVLISERENMTLGR